MSPWLFLRVLAAPLAVLGVALAAPAGAGAALTLKNWEAGTCSNVECTDAGSTSEFYTQAAGHPDFGITDFEFDYTESDLGLTKTPDGRVRDVRVDLPPGLAVDPEALPECSETAFEDFNCPEDTQVGEDEAIGTAALLSLIGLHTTVTEHFRVYNIERKPGEPARFGVEIKSTTLEVLKDTTGNDLEGHIYLEGGLSWHHEAETGENSGVATGDFHEYFKIQKIPEQPEIVKSKLIFWGIPQQHNGSGEAANGFITLPSTCESKQVTTLHYDSYESPGEFAVAKNETPVTATGCGALKFEPRLTAEPEENPRSDTPDGASFDLHIPQYLGETSRPDSPDVDSTTVTLPEGMTLDPSAANGLVACSGAQFQSGETMPECPAASQVGTATIDAPGIPDDSLTGVLYVGEPEAGGSAESGGKYRVFLAAYSARYGVGIRLEGRIAANPSTGQLTATFTGAPQIPFEDFQLHFNTGPRATIANPLSCGSLRLAGTVTPYGGAATAPATEAFSISQNPLGEACPETPPFALTQSVAPQSPDTAGAYSPFTFNIARADGQQYLSKVSTTLPPGLVGAIPSVALCGEPQAREGKCSEASKIGQVTVAAGAGSEPYTFTGSVYLTGPYGNAPYGLSIVVPAVAGPYNLGDVITQAEVNVATYTGQVTVTGSLPSVVEGVPIRLKNLSVAIDRKDFLFNPTSCAPLSVVSQLTSTAGATDSPSPAPFQVQGCSGLKFSPSLSASVGGKTSKANGAGIEVTVTQSPHQADLRQILVQLPKQLPSRLSTIQKACPQANFENGPPPGDCPTSARVGGASVTTPVLPGKLSGPAYLVSHGGEAFPDLDLILHGDGVTVVLVGHTHISSAGITTSNFESLPDVPISSATVTLPVGPSSVLTANGNLCADTLLAPTTLLAQSGAKITKNTSIAVTGCPVTVLSHKISGSTAVLTVRAPAAGRLSVGGHDTRTLTRKIDAAGTYTLKVHLNAAGVSAVRAHRKLKLRLRVGFVPAAAHTVPASAAYLAAKFR